jgi:hypothetical protein
MKAVTNTSQPTARGRQTLFLTSSHFTWVCPFLVHPSAICSIFVFVFLQNLKKLFKLSLRHSRFSEELNICKWMSVTPHLGAVTVTIHFVIFSIKRTFCVQDPHPLPIAVSRLREQLSYTLPGSHSPFKSCLALFTFNKHLRHALNYREIFMCWTKKMYL